MKAPLLGAAFAIVIASAALPHGPAWSDPTTDDEAAGATVERLIATAGFDAVRAGGLRDATRIEVAGDLHQYGGLNGNVVDADEARAAVAVAA